MKRVELLAPAGNLESFFCAVHAGADAVYLGGEKFGARAYADNFSEEELCGCIRYAHLFGRKVYLTLNTLVKEREMSELYCYLKPFYEAGLDGVIIQDMGVFAYVKEQFPGLSLHVSTQMAITGVEGAAKLKELGAERIVPARELSLEEIRLIKEKVDVEIECFIHGAMCYCYSGQCLFSSMLGGRSGNRGKCAQPCRLPYKIDGRKGKEGYFLSLKDMCTIEMLPALIEAGIDSFKIEGRMKKPEYAAGVTAMYRKYMDLYYEKGAVGYTVSKADMEMLKALYIRSEIGEGYYKRHNGASMVTVDKPSYSGSDERLLKEIREKYIEKAPKLAVKGKARFCVGEPAVLQLMTVVEKEGRERTAGDKTEIGDETETGNEIERGNETGDETGKEAAYRDNVTVKVQGPLVQEAMKQPMQEDTVRKQLEKFGNTCFSLQELSIEIEGSVFMPLKELNELRRSAVVQLEEKIRERNGLDYAKRRGMQKTEAQTEETAKTATRQGAQQEMRQEMQQESRQEAQQESRQEEQQTSQQEAQQEMQQGTQQAMQPREGKTQRTAKEKDNETPGFEAGIYAVVQTREQLRAVVELLAECGGVGAQSRREEADNAADETKSVLRHLKAVFVSTDIYEADETNTLVKDEAYEQTKQISGKLEGRVYAAYPYVMRSKDGRLHEVFRKEAVFAGILVRNMEELALLQHTSYIGQVVADAGLYIWNRRAKQFFDGEVQLSTMPFELNSGEQRELDGEEMLKVVYGRIPMMITANCLRKTGGRCLRLSAERQSAEEFVSLTDRMGKTFPVYTNCRHCYNVIYNSVPLSLHKKVKEASGKYRVDFTVEDARETKKILRYFCECFDKQSREQQPPYGEYTTGHEKRGAE